MKRSEMLKHMIEDIEQHLFTLEHRPNTRKHFPSILANELLDMIEGFGMLPPPEKLEEATSYLVYAYYPNVVGMDDVESNVDLVESQLWEPEDG